MRTQPLGVDMLTPEQYEVLASCANIWRHNVFWSLMALQQKLFSLPNAPVSEKEVLDLAGRYAELFRQYYGPNTARRIGSAAERYYRLYLSYLEEICLKSGKEPCPAEDDWVESARGIARELSTLNDFWREREWRAMLIHQIDILASEAKSTAAGDYSQTPLNYDVLDGICTEMGNYMALGLIRQFEI